MNDRTGRGASEARFGSKRMMSNQKTKQERVVAASVCLSMALVALVWLIVTVADWVGGRGEYNSVVPFLIGAALGLAIAVWPVSKVLSGWKKHVVRAIILTFCMAPLPFGPEGSLVPSVFGLLFPPMLLVEPKGVLLTFVCTLCLSIAVACIRE